MIDEYNRNINYVRLSVTDRCDLRCIHCMPEKGIDSLPHDKIMRYGEYVHICRIMSEIGIRDIKITGGEPLVRKRVSELVRSLKELDKIRNVTITTNGVLLEKYAGELARSGIDAVTVSLNAMNREDFYIITRRDRFDDVKRGINAMAEYPDVTMKINCVPAIVRSRDDLIKIAQMAKDRTVHVRFIEMMPIGEGNKMGFIGTDQVKGLLEDNFGPLKPFTGKLGNGPSEYYSVEGFKGRIGFISPMSHKFCHLCNRVRVTSEGMLKTCLQYNNGLDLKGLLKRDMSDKELRETIARAIYNKPEGHRFHENIPVAYGEKRRMSQIGG